MSRPKTTVTRRCLGLAVPLLLLGLILLVSSQGTPAKAQSSVQKGTPQAIQTLVFDPYSLQSVDLPTRTRSGGGGLGNSGSPSNGPGVGVPPAGIPNESWRVRIPRVPFFASPFRP